MHFQSGVLDKARLVSNILMLILVAGNIFFSIQYAGGIVRERDQAAANNDNTGQRALIAKFQKSFVDIVLSDGSKVSIDDRVKLEDEVLQTKDADIIKQWKVFVSSPDSKTAQSNAVKLMSIMANKMIP